MKSPEAKSYYVQSLALNDGLEDPVLESDFDFMQNRIDYENPSPLHNEDLDAYMETEDDIENRKDVDDLEDIDDELLIVSEEEAITCGVTCYDKHEEALSARIDIEAAEEEAADDFDESNMYRELAKMEIVEEEECIVISTIDKLQLEELKTHVEEELDLLGRPVRLYSTPRNQLVYAIGNIQISHSQARLFHLFDKNGEINVENIAKKSRDRSDKNYNNVGYKKTFCRVKALANPRCVDTSAVDEEAEKELTFQPTRSKQAGMAMRNKSCGYDFVDRLKANGEFLTRNTSGNKNLKTKNLNIELLKADYEALLDKVICPSCKNEQSFDENFEKIRECRRCNEKFVRAKTSNSSSFAKTNKENEEKRLLRLKNIESGVYGNLGKMPEKLGYPGKLKQKINNSCNNIENNKTKSNDYIDENNFDTKNEIENVNLHRNEDRSKVINKETIVNHHHRPIRSADNHVERERQSKLNANNKLIGIEIKNVSCLPDKKTTTIKSFGKKTSVDEFQKKIAVKKKTKKNSDGNASQWSIKRPLSLPLPPAYELLSDVSTSKIMLAVIEVVEEEDVGESANKNISDNHLTIGKELRRLVS